MNRTELVDKACLEKHTHGEEGEAFLRVRVFGEKWIDFKSIKNATLDALQNFDVDGKVLDFGVRDSEEIVTMLGNEIMNSLRRGVSIYLKETNKYALYEYFEYHGQDKG